MMDDLASQIVALLKAQKKTISTVESCTGGLIAAVITSVAGSSDVFETGFVTYSNAAKTALVGVPETLFDHYGAVSKPVASAMAEGALIRAKADLAISVTGIAGPSGGSVDKPVGMVCFGLSIRDAQGQPHTETQTQQFGDLGRNEVRQASVRHALQWAIESLRQTG